MHYDRFYRAVTMRAWPVARSIFDAPYVREANEGTTSWINRTVLLSHVATKMFHSGRILPSAKRPEGRAARGRPGNVWQPFYYRSSPLPRVIQPVVHLFASLTKSKGASKMLHATGHAAPRALNL